MKITIYFKLQITCLFVNFSKYLIKVERNFINLLETIANDHQPGGICVEQNWLFFRSALLYFFKEEKCVKKCLMVTEFEFKKLLKVNFL